MDIALKYYDRELLAESIRFNAQFLEMLAQNSEHHSAKHGNEELQNLVALLQEWKRRGFKANSFIDWAHEIATLYSKNADLLTFA